MATRITAGFFDTKHDYLPENMRKLISTALHMFDRRIGSKLVEVDYGKIEEMIDFASPKRKRESGESWLTVFYMIYHDDADALRRRWPSLSFRHNGTLISQSIFGQIYASVALWALQDAAIKYKAGNYSGAMDDVSMAGLALHMGAWFGGHEEDRLSSSDKQRVKAEDRWADDPIQQARQVMRAEWERWQLDRGLYKYPRDYRKAMLTKYPKTVDGTLKNWMSKWGRGEP